MRYLFDTDVVIDNLDDLPAIVSLLEGLAADGAAISIITYAEICQGIVESPTPEAAKRSSNNFYPASPFSPSRHLLHGDLPDCVPR